MAKKKGFFIKCKTCNKDFYVTPSLIKDGTKYCSRKCFIRNFKKNCLLCNKEFIVSPSLSHQKYCSYICANNSTKYLHSGENSNWWSGDKIGYVGLHTWLKRNFGKANHCENLNCSYKLTKRFEWALIKGKKYERKRENFWQLCKSCHKKYDMTDKTREKNRLRMLGVKMSIETKRKMSLSHSGKNTKH